MGNNQMATKEAGKALAEALAVNSVLKELDISGNGQRTRLYTPDGPGFAKELADGIKNNGALSSLDIRWNSIDDEALLDGIIKTCKHKNVTLEGDPKEQEDE